MLSLISRLQSLPASLRGGGLVAIGGLLILVVYMTAPRYTWVVVLGLALAVLALLIYKGVLKAIDKGKAKPFERRLAENAGAAPMGVSDAARRARLDDLRRKFEEGVATFREHGKDIYSLPWYLLVGEPGSGKTEAIRHCNVGFPPGLQDQLQGAGGTLNMNWWFTNHAVVLDTAGRLMFEEVEPGKTSEWREFLKQLRASRPNCPINGMLLVIPADSLIADTADSIQKKGGRIAEQLDSIQRALGVRFPVFVVITKCDLINGFREFFKDVTDPQLQGQILGWSNPGDLETAFRPEQVEAHLKSVAERLRRRRLGVLVDPVHSEDPISGRRTDEVDSLYSFPESLLKIAPRLRLYLEMIFVAGEWSAKPLFLRGLYLTSSMQEGAELDAELAEALKVDVKSLPEGRGFTRNTSYFLRDLFMAKVFQEKGLVTNATNIRKQQRTRRTVLLGTSVFGTLALMAGTWFAAKGHEKAVGESSDFWGQMARVMGAEIKPSDRMLVVPKAEDPLRLYEYAGGDTNFTPGSDTRVTVRVDGKEVQKYELPLRTREMAATKEETPLMFRPVAGLTGGDVFARELPSHERVLSAIVLNPSVEALLTRLERPTPSSWEETETAALAQALKLRAAANGITPAEGSVFDLGAVMAYCVPRDELPPPEHFQQLQDVIDWTYSDKGGGLKWPPAELRDLIQNPDLVGLNDPIGTGVGRFIETWASAASKGSRLPGADTLKKLSDLQDAVKAMQAAETALVTNVSFEKVDTVEQYNAAADDFKKKFADLEAAHNRVAAASTALGLGAGDPNLARRLETAINEARSAARAAYDQLLGTLGPKPEAGVDEPAPIKSVRDRLELGWTGLNEQWTRQEASLRGDLAGLESAQLARRDNGEPTFERRYRVYQAAQARLELARTFSPAGELFKLGDELNDAGKRTEQCGATITAQFLPPDENDKAMTDARMFAQRAAEAAQRREIHDAIAKASNSLSGNDALAALVRQRAQDSGAQPIPRPTLAMAPGMNGGEFDASYHPQVAKTVIDAAVSMRQRVVSEPGTAGVRPLDAKALEDGVNEVRNAVSAYVDAYSRYWSVELERAMQVQSLGDWEKTREEFRAVNITSTNSALKGLAETATKALALPEPFAGQLSDSVKASRARFTEMLGALGDEVYTGAVSDVRSEWRKLPAAAADAATTILAMTPDDFAEDFLGSESRVYGEGAGNRAARVPYWSDVIRVTLKDLSGESERQATQAFKSLMRNRRAAPLCADESLSLSREDMFQTFKEVDGIRLASSGGNAGGTLIRDGARLPSGFNDADDMLAAMRGGGAVSDKNEREWFTLGLRPVVDFLRGPEADNPTFPTWELVILPYDYSAEHRQAADQFKQLSISGGGLGQNFNIDTRQPNEQTGVRLSVAPSQAITMKFHELFAAGGDAGLSQDVRLDPTWSILGTLRTGKWRAIETKPGLYAVPIPLSKPGWTGTYWLGIRFAGRDPGTALRNWPTTATWPQGR